MDTNQGDNISKNLFNNVNSKYIIAKIIDHVQKPIWLELFKYNKNIQNRLNIFIYDYKEYYEKFTPIILEIIPVKNSVGTFINLDDKEKDYYHIYFNDSKIEIKRYDITKEDKITKIKIIIDYQIESFKGLFSEVQCIESITFKKFKRSNT